MGCRSLLPSLLMHLGACIDIGTNTVLLAVAALEADGTLTRLDDRLAIARLGEGVDRTRRLSNEAMERTLACVEDHLSVLSPELRPILRVTATSAVRDARNRQDLIDLLRRRHGLELEVLSGEDEALWTWRGALSDLPIDPMHRTAVLDIGGGSTELTVGLGDQLLHRASADVGAVRLTERILHAPTGTRAQARSIIRDQLARLPDFDPTHTTFFGVAGTVTTLAMMELNLRTWSADAVSGFVLTAARVKHWSEVLATTPSDELVARWNVEPGRADILPAGTLILEELMEMRSLPTIRVSVRGLRFGIILRDLRSRLCEGILR